jgi:P27 family predicted phage terminase small subunit
VPGGTRPNSGPRPVVVVSGGSSVPAGFPPPPSWLPTAARAHYRKVGRQLVDAGVLTHLDGTVLAQHAAAWSRWQAGERAMLTNGSVVPGPNGTPVASPWVKITRDAYVEVLRTAVELGLTPSARGRVKVSSDQSVGVMSSPIARLMASRSSPSPARDWWDTDDGQAGR